MKHIRLPLCGRRYALVGIDVCTKQAVIHVSGTCTSQTGRTAYRKVIARFGRGAVYVNDNGGENQGGAERMIETLQTECLDYLLDSMSVSELQREIDRWLKKYHGYRPHESLGFLTPNEFAASFNLLSSTGLGLS